MERELRLYDFLFGYAQRLTADLPDARFCEQPAEGVNHPAWLLGHLCISNDYVLGLLGKNPQCNGEWHDQFGAGSRPGAVREDFPSKEALWNRFRDGSAAVKLVAAEASPAVLARPNPLEVDGPQQGLPTLGDLVAHLMTTHLALHLGQLSAWRRMTGFPPVG